MRLDSEGLPIETQIAVPTLLRCPVCSLELEGMAKLAAAGLGEPISLKEHVDPIEAFDVDLSDYRDEFLRSLAEEDAYQDE